MTERNTYALVCFEFSVATSAPSSMSVDCRVLAFFAADYKERSRSLMPNPTRIPSPTNRVCGESWVAFFFFKQGWGWILQRRRLEHPPVQL